MGLGAGRKSKNRKGRIRTHKDSLGAEICSVDRILSKKVHFLNMKKGNDGQLSE